MKFQAVRLRQRGDEDLILISFRAANAVIEMDHGQHHAQLRAKLEQDPQQCHGIGASGNSDPNTIARPQQFLAANVSKHLFGQTTHSNMVNRSRRRLFGGADRNNVLNLFALSWSAWDAGFKDPAWARRDPDLELLHGDPEFDRLYPEKLASGAA